MLDSNQEIETTTNNKGENNMERIEAIKKAGIKAVETVESMKVEFSNRVTEGTYLQVCTEFSANVDFINENNETSKLIMYVYIDSDDIDKVKLILI